ncbi:MAG: hypothetical protein HC923_12250 [Myxococcales bacterium]|nr:hypothetical protein [Myxococcales bacterium]
MEPCSSPAASSASFRSTIKTSGRTVVAGRAGRRLGAFALETAIDHRLTRVRELTRDYSLTRGQLRIEYSFGSATSLALWGGYAAYDFVPQPEFSFEGPLAGASARRDIADGWFVSAWVEGQLYAYDGPPLQSSEGLAVFCVDCEDNRFDREVRFGAQLARRGAWLGGLDALVRIQDSNSEAPLEDITRLRLTANCTVPLFWELLLSVQGILQINFGRSPTDLATQDNEEEQNRNNLQLQLRRPISSQVSVDVRYAWYANFIQGSDEVSGDTALGFSRHTAFLGLTVRTEAETR